MSTALLNHALLRPAIIQILRATGFHGARTSVVDTLTDIAARYMALLAARAVVHANSNHNDPVPDVTDVRLAMLDCGLLTPGLTATEEVWRELLRTPLLEIPERNGVRNFEERKREEEDTEDVRDFVSWFDGSVNKEIKRITGSNNDAKQPGEADTTDYLTAIKKKHSKMGEESRYQGTVLGIGSESRPVKIEGGPASLAEWLQLTSRLTSTPEEKPSTNDIIMSL